ncbi:MAG: HD domain-containing phosphohydrolase [Motiliproteus sp.]
MSTIDGMIVTFEGEQISVHSGTGEFSEHEKNTPRIKELTKACVDLVVHNKVTGKLRQGALVLPLKMNEKAVGFVYLETSHELTEADRNLIEIFTSQCSSTFESLKLHLDLTNSYRQAIDMLAEVAEFKDSDTGGHINRLAAYTLRVAMEVGIPKAEAEAYAQAARLHDVGKVGIPDSIIQKPGKLTTDEYDMMKLHTDIGARIFSQVEGMEHAKDVALNHHERWDGKGYPNGKRGDDISLLTRIVSLVDVFDALVSKRSYKPAWRPEDAKDHLRNNAGEHFDPQVVDAFIRLYERGGIDDLIMAVEH